MYSPLLGDPSLSVLRELHDYQRCLQLVEQVEVQRHEQYERVVWSRLEYRWFAAHPPLHLLPSSYIWAPNMVYGPFGVDDNHAVLSRAAADVYLGRWASLFSPDLIERFGLSTLASSVTEQFLDQTLDLAGLEVRPFAPTMATACCTLSNRCFLKECYMAPLYGVRGAPRGVLGGTYARLGNLSTVYGKRGEELRQAAIHAGLLRCPGAQYEVLQDGATVGISLPGPPLPDALSSSPLTTPLVHLRGRAQETGEVEQIPQHCPMASPNWIEKEGRDGEPRAARGFCEDTPERIFVGDCESGDHGEWEAKFDSARISNLADCIDTCRRCERCNFVSLSFAKEHRACMWFHACPAFPHNLLHAPTAPDMVTVHVTDATATSTRSPKSPVTRHPSPSPKSPVTRHPSPSPKSPATRHLSPSPKSPVTRHPTGNPR